MYTRNPDNGENQVYGEYIRCAEGDEVMETVERQTYRLEVGRSRRRELRQDVVLEY
jgi:hypothetical protein